MQHQFNICTAEQRSVYRYNRQLSDTLQADDSDFQRSRRALPRPVGVRLLAARNRRRIPDPAAGSYFRTATTFSRQTSDSLLLEALRERRFEQLRRLLDAKGLYAPVHRFSTIADYAVKNKDAEVLQLLGEMGYDFNRRNQEGMVPFHYAVLKASCDMMVLLHSLGASPDVPYLMSPSSPEAKPASPGRNYSEFPLHIACSMHATSVLRVLLEDCAADTSVQDCQENTALLRACLEDSLSHAALLIDFCSVETLNMRGFEGKTALHVAVLNQNRRLMERLLQAGALVDIPANNGKTVIDIILEINNPMMLGDYVRFCTARACEGVNACSLRELTYFPVFQKFLEFLSRIDNEFQSCRIEYKDLSETETKELCSRLEFDDRIDLIEFKEVILQLLQTEVIHSLTSEEADGTLCKVVENVVHYVMFREDAELLERIMLCGELWMRMAQMMEDKLDALYLQAPEREVNGIVQHFRTHFVQDARVQRHLLVRHYGQLCGCYSLPPYRPEMSVESRYMRHPLDTLPVWSILCGRLSLTELLLRQEQFDVLPLALFCAALLRTFAKNPELVVEPEEIEELALVCERFARKAVEKQYSLDTSYKRSVTVDYLLAPLAAYGGVSCLQLAAANHSAHFLQSESCQLALDKKWFGSLLYTNTALREGLIWMGAVPLNILTPVLLYCLDIAEARARRRHERPSMDKYRQPITSGKFRLNFLASSQSGESFKPQQMQPLARQLQKEKRKLRKESNKLQKSSSLQKNSELQESSSLQKNIELHEPDSAAPLRASLLPDNSERLSLLSNSSSSSCPSISVGRFFELLFNFYAVPAVKFRYHVASHVLLVVLLSYCLLINFTYQISGAEIVAFAILFGMLLEEIGEIAHFKLRNNMRAYLKSKWNIIDIAALTCGCIGFFIRLIEMFEMRGSSAWTGMQRDFLDRPWYTARIFLSICCTLYWVRLLYISTVLENLGPKLNMIAKMITKDLMPFLLVLFIFIFGFGVLMHSLLYPNGYRAWNPKQLNKVHVFLGMLKICFYSMVGEYSLDSILGGEQCEGIYENRTVNQADCPHHFGRYLVPYVVLPLYVIVTEILLLNLIIAMFSKTIDQIDSRSKGVWQFERHNLVEEFESRSALPPPLNALDLARKLLQLVARRCAPCRLRQRAAASTSWFCGCFCCWRTSGSYFQPVQLLQFLLHQALALRNSREDLMRLSLPKQETEAEGLLTRIRAIVEEEVRTALAEQLGADTSGQYDTGERLARGTLFEACPSSNSILADASEAEARTPQLESGARSQDSIATDRSRSVVLRDLA